MADRRSTSPRRRAPAASPSVPVPPQRTPADPRVANAPLVDLIFPNRSPNGNGSYEPTVADLDRAAGFGPPAHDGQHRKRLFGRRRTQAATGYRPLADKPVRRRRVLLGLGTGVVAAGGVGGAAALLAGGIGAASAGRHRRGRTPRPGSARPAWPTRPRAAAIAAAAATPTWPTPLTRDPELHLLRRATFGPTLVDVVALKQMGIDAWLERQFSPQNIADPGGDAVLATYPTVSMSTAELRVALKDDDNLAQHELGRATLGRQIWSSRQLFEVMVDFWGNHLNVTNPFDGGWDSRTVYDNEVIRAHALGRFSDMLAASARSVAMMRYLDNASSRKKSVNENYGRELLELHTVGLDAKYSEVDVRQSAYIMTGRMVDRNCDVLLRQEPALDRRGEGARLRPRQHRRGRGAGRSASST